MGPRPAIRRMLVGAVGHGAYLLGYSAASIVVLGWPVVAARRAPFVLLSSNAAWQARLANLAMPLAGLLVAFAPGASHPLSFGGCA